MTNFRKQNLFHRWTELRSQILKIIFFSNKFSDVVYQHNNSLIYYSNFSLWKLQATIHVFFLLNRYTFHFIFKTLIIQKCMITKSAQYSQYKKTFHTTPTGFQTLNSNWHHKNSRYVFIFICVEKWGIDTFFAQYCFIETYA